MRFFSSSSVFCKRQETKNSKKSLWRNEDQRRKSQSASTLAWETLLRISRAKQKNSIVSVRFFPFEHFSFVLFSQLNCGKKAWFWARVKERTMTVDHHHHRQQQKKTMDERQQQQMSLFDISFVENIRKNSRAKKHWNCSGISNDRACFHCSLVRIEKNSRSRIAFAVHSLAHLPHVVIV